MGLGDRHIMVTITISPLLPILGHIVWFALLSGVSYAIYTEYKDWKSFQRDSAFMTIMIVILVIIIVAGLTIGGYVRWV